MSRQKRTARHSLIPKGAPSLSHQLYRPSSRWPDAEDDLFSKVDASAVVEHSKLISILDGNVPVSKLRLFRFSRMSEEEIKSTILTLKSEAKKLPSRPAVPPKQTNASLAGKPRAPRLHGALIDPGLHASGSGRPVVVPARFRKPDPKKCPSCSSRVLRVVETGNGRYLECANRRCLVSIGHTDQPAGKLLNNSSFNRHPDMVDAYYPPLNQNAYPTSEFHLTINQGVVMMPVPGQRTLCRVE